MKSQQIEYINYGLKYANLNDYLDHQNCRKTKRPRKKHDLNDCFKIELAKPVSSKQNLLNLASIFDSSNSISSSKKQKTNNSIDDSIDLGNFFSRHSIRLKFLEVDICNLNLINKDNLLYLIEKNFSHGIKCPFDLFAYNRLSKTKPSSRFDEKNLYNFSQVNKISKIFSDYQNNPLDSKFLRNNSLLACTVGSFLMPFYFDLFRVSELNQFSPIEIDLVLVLKKNYKISLYLNYDSLIRNFKENILWNCLTIYKYKLDDTNRLEFFNYFLALMFTLYHSEIVVNYLQRQLFHENKIFKIHVIKALELSAMIPLLLEAFILTGIFSHKQFIKYENFATNRLNTLIQNDSYNIEKKYYEKTLDMIGQTRNQVFPIKLSNLCRLKIRNSLIDCNQFNVKKLPCSNEIKNFILYQTELKNCFDKYKCRMN